MKDSGEVQLWTTDGLLLGSLSLQTDVTFTSKHLNHLKTVQCWLKYEKGGKLSGSDVCLGDVCGLLSYCTICSCWNSFRNRALRWPEEEAAASAGAQDPSLPLCGSFAASISISRSFIYFIQTWCCKSKVCLFAVCVCFVLVFNSFDQRGYYLFTGASDSHIFVLNAKPSERFSVIGYTGRHCFRLF